MKQVVAKALVLLLAVVSSVSIASSGEASGRVSPMALPFPQITAYSPDNGAVGTRVDVYGTNFRLLPSENEVRFDNVLATVDNVIDSGHLVVTVPAGAQTGKISLQTPDGLVTSWNDFTVTPRITGFSPDNGARGTLVTVDGNNFGPAPSLSVAGAPVPVTVVNDNQVTFTIPGTLLGGVVSLTTSGWTCSAASPLTVKPTITGLSASSGAVGGVVTITGYNFDNTAAGATQVVFGGGVAATVDPAASDRTSLSVQVPAGAATGPISVTTSGGSAVSASFSITASTPPAGGSSSSGGGCSSAGRGPGPLEGALGLPIMLGPAWLLLRIQRRKSRQDAG
ncbi:MAG TPA: IPT/TIG domain-containing protein [Candidatus Deferrimicrobiaceae bacterium]